MLGTTFFTALVDILTFVAIGAYGYLCATHWFRALDNTDIKGFHIIMGIKSLVILILAGFLQIRIGTRVDLLLAEFTYDQISFTSTFFWFIIFVEGALLGAHITRLVKLRYRRFWGR